MAFLDGKPVLGGSARLALAVAALAALGGCGHDPLERRLSQPSYYFDNALPFQPNRIWRLKVRWEPYLLSSSKAMVFKQFQLIAHGSVDRRRLTSEIAGRGGDERYLRWFESEVFPLGNWEVRDEARIIRLSDAIVVSLSTHALKESEMEGGFSVDPVAFPDPIIRSVDDGCHELNWEVIPKDESVGFEVVLQSRSAEPSASKWTLREHDSKTLYWRQWSVGQDHSIAYRTVVQFKNNVSRCPLPPEVRAQFKAFEQPQKMEVDW